MAQSSIGYRIRSPSFSGRQLFPFPQATKPYSFVYIPSDIFCADRRKYAHFFLPESFPTQLLPDYTLPYILLLSLKNLTWKWFQSICSHVKARFLRDCDGRPGLRLVGGICDFVCASPVPATFMANSGWMDQDTE